MDSILIEFFPEYKSSGGDINILKQELEKYYTYGPYKPKVSIEENLIKIEIDTPAILNEETDYRKVVSLCESGKYKEAKQILDRLLDSNPSNSEYHRIYGQILSEEGDQDKAINHLIDALKWDPKNGYALIMVGNIFARFRNDLETARKYYDEVLRNNPGDYLAINNIGGMLLQIGKVNEAIEFLEKAYAINPDYPNTLYALSLAYAQEGASLIAFDFATECLKKSSKKDNFYKTVFNHTLNLADNYAKTDLGDRVFNEYKNYLERRYKTSIKVVADTTLPTAAKLEIAENYERDYHLIKYKPGYRAIAHLKMHELVHLEFIEEARTERANMLFVSGAEKRVRFLRENEKEQNKLQKEGLSENSISSFMTALYDGINRQIYNAPIDLFIEDYLNEHYKELRPYQLTSILNLLYEGKQGVTDKRAQKFTPQVVLKASKILNIVNAIQFKDLFGVDLIKDFEPLPFELKEAERMWEEYVEYRTDRSPGEEYELIKHWAEDLRVNQYFDLVDEIDFRNKPQSIEDLLTSASEDPMGINEDKNFKDRQTKTFLESQTAIGLNKAVLFFMVDALKYFKGQSAEKIKATAFEIAMIGTQGINPAAGHKYNVPSIPGIEFSGYHLLAYYYVSWKLAIPEMVSQLNLPYDKEYQAAQSLSLE